MYLRFRSILHSTGFVLLSSIFSTCQFPFLYHLKEVSMVIVLEYWCWYTASIVNLSVFDALSIGRGLVAAVLLRVIHGTHILWPINITIFGVLYLHCLSSDLYQEMTLYAAKSHGKKCPCGDDYIEYCNWDWNLAPQSGSAWKETPMFTDNENPNKRKSWPVLRSKSKTTIIATIK